MSADIIGHGLELLEQLLRLVNDGLVLQHGAVVLDVHGRGLGFQRGLDALGVGVAFAECLQGRDGFWKE